MTNKITKYLIKGIMFIITLIVITLGIIIKFSGNATFKDNWFITILGFLVTPIFLANLFFFIYWSFKKSYILILPLAILILNFNIVTSIFQINFKKNENKTPITIATYNVHHFNLRHKANTVERIAIALNNNNSDIICLQEFGLKEKSLNIIKHNYPYSYLPLSKYNKHEMAIFSKYPIIDSGQIEFSKTINSMLYVVIKIGDKKIKIINAHLQTTNINQSWREIGILKDDISIDKKKVETFNTLKNRIMYNVKKRKVQVDTITSIIQKTPFALIVCGDFNDTPASYSYKQINSFLHDGFKTCGSGYMSTIKGSYGMLRIDYIFHSDDISGIKYYSPNIEYSDHKPVFMKFSI